MLKVKGVPVAIEGSFNVTEILRQGVYLLSREGRVVYVGQSKCMLARIYAHRNLARKRVPSWLPIRGVVFDTVEVIPCHPDRIDALERGLIDLYRPVCNRTHNLTPPQGPADVITHLLPAPTNPFAGRRL